MIWSVLGRVTQPIWHGGALSAEVERAQAELEQRVAEYADALVAAWVEVELALAGVKQSRARLAALQHEQSLARAALAAADLYYRQGLVDFLSLLETEQALRTVELGRLQAEQDWLRARVDLHVALAEELPPELEPPSRLDP